MNIGKLEHICVEITICCYATATDIHIYIGGGKGGARGAMAPLKI